MDNKEPFWGNDNVFQLLFLILKTYKIESFRHTKIWTTVRAHLKKGAIMNVRSGALSIGETLKGDQCMEWSSRNARLVVFYK